MTSLTFYGGVGGIGGNKILLKRLSEGWQSATGLLGALCMAYCLRRVAVVFRPLLATSLWRWASR